MVHPGNEYLLDSGFQGFNPKSKIQNKVPVIARTLSAANGGIEGDAAIPSY